MEQSIRLSSSFADTLSLWRQQSRVASTLYFGSYCYRTTPDMTTNREADYVTLRGGMLSYLPASKYNTSEPWSRAGRQTGRPAKVARKIIAPAALASLTDKDFELFASLVASTDVTRRATFQLVDGSEIVHWYYWDNYESESGTLSSSCMRYDDCQPNWREPFGYFGIYAANPERCKMLCLVNNETDKLIGRALVWKADDGETYLDRVYGTAATQEAFFDYAATQGWFRKAEQSYENGCDWITPDGSEERRYPTVTLVEHRFAQYPYVDTFKYQHTGGVLAVQMYLDGIRAEAILSDTDGSRELLVACCAGCGDRVDDDDAGYCNDCWAERFTECEACGCDVPNDHVNTSPDGDPLCYYCYAAAYHSCQRCYQVYARSDANNPGAREGLCVDCYRSLYQPCISCSELTRDRVGSLCRECHASMRRPCRQCSARDYGHTDAPFVDGYCHECARHVRPQCQTCGVRVPSRAFIIDVRAWDSAQRYGRNNVVRCVDCERARLLAAVQNAALRYRRASRDAGQVSFYLRPIIGDAAETPYQLAYTSSDAAPYTAFAAD